MKEGQTSNQGTLTKSLVYRRASLKPNKTNVVSFSLPARCLLMMRAGGVRRLQVLTTPATQRSCLKRSLMATQTPIGSSLNHATTGNRGALSFATTTKIPAVTASKIPIEKKLYLHVGPSGDSWIGDAIFAAKHNQPGYVKSIPLTSDKSIATDTDEADRLVDILEEHPEWAQEIYDTERLPEALKERMKLIAEDDTNS